MAKFFLTIKHKWIISFENPLFSPSRRIYELEAIVPLFSPGHRLYEPEAIIFTP